jgi:ElaB/YqjD/DUF883 family membrane-anchored ribosome-binding protein
MRKGFALLLLVAVLFGGGYFYYIAQAVCPIPLSYSIGDIGEDFDITRDEARLAVSEAESVWENATGKNLFTYAEDGKLKINFVYDERQQFIEAEDSLKEKLDATENISDALKSTYADLVAEYDELRASYEDRVEEYKEKLEDYNTEVEKYNSQGGAPADIYDALTKQKRSLDIEQTELNTLSAKLNALVTEINNVGEKGNSIITTYNKGVNTYNEAFGEPREFTQGDYSNKTIKIYTFEDKDELTLVLVHELGHALSLNHVEGAESVMYYLIGGQPVGATLSANDLAEFNRVCGQYSFWERIKMSIQR